MWNIIKLPFANVGALRDDDILLFVCSFVTCEILLSHSLGGSTWRQSDTLVDLV